MKDALGHGSSANRTDFARNKIAISSGARFSVPPRPMPRMSANDHISDLRNRLSTAQGPGHVATLLQGIKNAMGYST
jgi:hypothetical protein